MNVVPVGCGVSLIAKLSKIKTKITGFCQNCRYLNLFGQSGIYSDMSERINKKGRVTPRTSHNVSKYITLKVAKYITLK